MAGGWAEQNWATNPWALSPGAIAANPLLTRPSCVWCFELFLDSSFPITFPWTFDAPPLRVSWFDFYPEYPAVGLSDVLYEGRLLDRPAVSLAGPDQFAGGLQTVEGVRFRVAATDPYSAYPNLHLYVSGEHRGKLVLGHLVQLDAKFRAVEVAQNVFRGEILALADDPSGVDVLCRALDLSSLTETVPQTRVTTATYPYAPSGPAPSGGLGDPTNLGIGIGRRIPGRYVRAKTEDDTAIEFGFTVTAAADRLTTTSVHFLDTGAGPLRVSSTGTLPGGLDALLEYWAIADQAGDNELRLAATRGDAFAGIGIDITSTGTGVHTLRGGLPPLLVDEYDVELGHGNLGVCRIWFDANSDGASASEPPEAPITYTVLPKTYKPDGRYVTAVRFTDPIDGVEVTADVIRCYPDVDESTLGEWKWLRGFTDEIGTRHAISDPIATQLTTTADLCMNHQGFGLGAVNLPVGSQKVLQLPNPYGMLLQSFTWQMEIVLPPGVPANQYLVWGPGGDTSSSSTSLHSWSIRTTTGDRLIIRVRLGGFSTGGSTFSALTQSGSVPRGRPLLLTFRRDGATGRTDFFVGTTLATWIVDPAPGPRPIDYLNPTQPMRLMGTPIAAADACPGKLGWCRFSARAITDQEIRESYWLWRRNGMQFARELARLSRYAVDEELFEQACVAWDTVEHGTLRADGWLTEENRLVDALAGLIPFRDIRFFFTPESKIAAVVPEAPVDVKATFGHGEDFSNLLALPTRATASLTEAVKELVVRFRRSRNGASRFGGFEQEVRRPVNTVGADEQLLEVPYLDDTAAADVVVDFQAKRRRTRSQLLTLALNHEARLLTLGDVVRLQLPALGMTDVDGEIIAIAKGAERADVRVVPTAAADFTYTKALLPADPPARTLGAPDFGNLPVMTASYSNGRVLVTLVPQQSWILRPTGTTDSPTFNAWPTTVGAATKWEAVNEVVANDASYVQSTLGAFEYQGFKHEPLTIHPLSRITSLIAHARLKRTNTVPVQLRPNWYVPKVDTIWGPSGTPWNPTTTFADFTFEQAGTLLYLPPYTPSGGKNQWSVALVNDLELVIQIGGGGPGSWQVQMSQVFLEAIQQLDIPNLGGFVRYWVAGPNASQPPIPLESDPTVIPPVLDFGPQAFDLAGTSGQKYWIWARVYDEFSRLIATIGPANQTGLVIP